MSDVEHSPTGAVITALAKPAIPNGKAKTGKSRTKPIDYSKLNGVVQVKQPAAGRWKCDTCKTTGTGGGAILRHAAKSNHRVFTDLDYK